MSLDDELRQAREQVAALVARLRVYAEAAGQRDALLQELQARRQAQEQAETASRVARGAERALTEALDAARAEVSRAVAQRSAMLTRMVGREEEVARLEAELERSSARLGAWEAEAEKWAEAEEWRKEAARVPELEGRLEHQEQRWEQLRQREAEVARASLQLELHHGLATERDSLRAALAQRSAELDAAHAELVALHDLALRSAEQTRSFARVQRTLTVREEELQVARTVARDQQRRVARLLPLRTEVEEARAARDALASQVERLAERARTAEDRCLELHAENEALQGQLAEWTGEHNARRQEHWRQLLAQAEERCWAAETGAERLQDEVRASAARLQQAEQAASRWQQQLHASEEHAQERWESVLGEWEAEQARCREAESAASELRRALAKRDEALQRQPELVAALRAGKERLSQTEAELRGQADVARHLSAELERGLAARDQAEARAAALGSERDRLRARLGQLSAQVKQLMGLPQLADRLQQQLADEREASARLEDQLDALRHRSQELQGAADQSRARQLQLSGALQSREDQVRTLHSRSREALALVTRENQQLRARLDPPPRVSYDPLTLALPSAPLRWRGRA